MLLCSRLLQSSSLIPLCFLLRMYLTLTVCFLPQSFVVGHARPFPVLHSFFFVCTLWLHIMRIHVLFRKILRSVCSFLECPRISWIYFILCLIFGQLLPPLDPLLYVQGPCCVDIFIFVFNIWWHLHLFHSSVCIVWCLDHVVVEVVSSTWTKISAVAGNFWTGQRAQETSAVTTNPWIRGQKFAAMEMSSPRNGDLKRHVAGQNLIVPKNSIAVKGGLTQRKLQETHVAVERKRTTTRGGYAVMDLSIN